MSKRRSTRAYQTFATAGKRGGKGSAKKRKGGRKTRRTYRKARRKGGFFDL